MRINTLFILFLLSTIPASLFAVNSVSGVYLMPVQSVRFEKMDNLSIMPIGWSKDGNTAFLVYNRENWSQTIPAGAKLIIINAIDDREIWQSEVYEVNNTISLSLMWNNNIDLFSEKLSIAGIIPDENPQYGGTGFSLNDENFRISIEETRETGFRGISTLNLLIKSGQSGIKSLYKYVGSRGSVKSLVDYSVMGYFKSPWEKRIVVFSVEDYLDVDGEESFGIRITGSHLSIGFTVEVNEESKLIDAVISGQFYNSKNLLKNGADPDVIINSGESLLFMTALQANWDIVFLLLDYGADPFSKDQQKRTLLHYGAIWGDKEVFIKLLQLGIDPDLSDSKGETAHSLAVKNGNNELSDLLQNP